MVPHSQMATASTPVREASRSVRAQRSSPIRVSSPSRSRVRRCPAGRSARGSRRSDSQRPFPRQRPQPRKPRQPRRLPPQTQAALHVEPGLVQGARPGGHVHRVDGCGDHGDPHLTRARRRRLDIADGQHLRAADSSTTTASPWDVRNGSEPGTSALVTSTWSPARSRRANPSPGGCSRTEPEAPSSGRGVRVGGVHTVVRRRSRLPPRRLAAPAHRGYDGRLIGWVGAVGGIAARPCEDVHHAAGVSSSYDGETL
jgi:hypothetical protein